MVGPVLNIGGPFKKNAARYKVAYSVQAGIRPRAETPNVGGKLTIAPDYNYIAMKEERRLGEPFIMINVPSVGTDVF